eukprot:8352632-Lingulodinium_polyedra.AAC.1
MTEDSMKQQVVQRVGAMEANAELRIREVEVAMRKGIVDLEEQHHQLEQRSRRRAAEAAQAEALSIARFQHAALVREKRIVGLEEQASERAEQLHEYIDEETNEAM